MEKNALLKKGGLPKQNNKSTLSKTPVLCPLHPSFSKFWGKRNRKRMKNEKKKKQRKRRKRKGALGGDEART